MDIPDRPTSPDPVPTYKVLEYSGEEVGLRFGLVRRDHGRHYAYAGNVSREDFNRLVWPLMSDRARLDFTGTGGADIWR